MSGTDFSLNSVLCLVELAGVAWMVCSVSNIHNA